MKLALSLLDNFFSKYKIKNEPSFKGLNLPNVHKKGKLKVIIFLYFIFIK
jgi:hypothetical protein